MPPLFLFEIIVFIFSVGALLAVMILLTTPFDEKALRRNIFDKMSEPDNNYTPELKGIINAEDATKAISENWTKFVRKTLYTSRGLRIKVPISDDDSETDDEKKEILDLKKIRTNTLPDGGNNCLFEATLDALSIDRRRITPQMLRNVCDLVLTKEGFPLIPKGETAGEQYLQAISKIFGKKIIVDKDGYKSSVVIRHWEVPENCGQFKLRHLGHSVYGHWVSGE